MGDSQSEPNQRMTINLQLSHDYGRRVTLIAVDVGWCHCCLFNDHFVVMWFQQSLLFLMVAGSYRVSGDNGWLLLELISRNISSQLLWSIKNVALICICFVAVVVVVVNNVSLGTIVGFGCCCCCCCSAQVLFLANKRFFRLLF